MTAAGIYVHGATVALTRRTVLRKAFLAPWSPQVKQIWLYNLAEAQRRLGVAVHHSTLVVNHHHTSVTAPGQSLPEFTRYVTRETSVAVQELLRREGYDTPGQLFDSRRTHRLRLIDAEAQASQVLYEYLNTVAAGLVSRPEHMPGPTLDFGHWKTGFVDVERPEVYSTKRDSVLRLHLTPLPELYRAFGGDLDALVHHMKRLGEEGIRALRAQRKGPPKGAQALARMHPWSEPRTPREENGQPVPTFRIGARGLAAKTRRIEGAREVSGFRKGHDSTRVARRDGDRGAVYPYGTYAAVVYRGAPVEAEPLEGAIVTAPGPMLEDVKAELARCPVAREKGAVVDEVRSAFAEEAGSIVEEEWLEMVEPSADSGEGDAVVVDRMDKPDAARVAAKRIVTQRDRRPGLPREDESGRHGSDPAD